MPVATGEETEEDQHLDTLVGLWLEWRIHIEIHIKLWAEVGVVGEFESVEHTSSHILDSFTL